jgi:hypothetical protein
MDSIFLLWKYEVSLKKFRMIFFLWVRTCEICFMSKTIKGFSMIQFKIALIWSGAFLSSLIWVIMWSQLNKNDVLVRLLPGIIHLKFAMNRQLFNFFLPFKENIILHQKWTRRMMFQKFDPFKIWFFLHFTNDFRNESIH